jgi:hypothetical protein
MVVHRVPAPVGFIEGTASSPLPWGLLLLARSVLIAQWNPTRSPRIHGCAFVHPMFADVCIRSPYVCRRLHTSGPRIHGCASSPGPQGIAAAGPAPVDRSMVRQPSPLGSIEGIASSPLPWGLLLLSRSVLIAQWNPTRSPRIHGCAFVHPMFADVCILLDLGSMVVHRVPARSVLIARWNPTRSHGIY